MKPSLERYKQILRRQEKPKFGSDYEPSIRATREEAPNISIATQSWSSFLGRRVHTLSGPETKAASLALYHPNLIDLHEQRMLSVFPEEHPFARHSVMDGKLPLPVRGTFEVAEKLGYSDHHPMIPVDKHKFGCDWLPFPYIGDLLLFLYDEAGPYCVNWNIKAKKDGFEKPLAGIRSSKRQDKAINKAIARHQIEIAYYMDAEIRTVDIAETDIDSTLVKNLRHLLKWNSRPGIQNKNLRDEAVLHFKLGLTRGIPPVDTVLFLIRKNGGDKQDYLVTLYQAIWRRTLRVDLFRRVLVDRPLLPEKKDPLNEYYAFFAR